MSQRSRPRLVRTGDDKLDRNFDEIARHLSDAVVNGAIGPLVSIVSGTNTLHPSVKHPRGYNVVFKSAAVTFTDTGLDANGNWVLSASGPCTARFQWLE